MRTFLRLLPCLLLPFAACGGGSKTSAGAQPTSGAVYLVVDTAAGSEALVQFQVAAAVFERRDGSSTGNLLASAKLLTVADPSGQVDGLTLPAVPTGDYTALHLMLVPGSGAMLQANGTVLPAMSDVDLVVPIADGLQHAESRNSWLALGHNSAPPAASGTMWAWTPSLSARVDGSSHELDGMRLALVQATTLTTQLGVANDGLLQVEFAAGCSFADDDGSSFGGRDDFLRSLGSDDDLRVHGELHRSGRVLANHVHRGRGNDNPRLLGRITELRPVASSFVMDVQAEVRRGERHLLPVPVSVLVLANGARIHRSDSRDVLTFADLQVGNLVKIEWVSRTAVPGSRDEVVAREIEATSSAQGLHPEWEGLVQSVDAVAGTIVVVRRHDDPIVIEGVAVSPVTLHVDGDTLLQRREGHGSGTGPIGLADIVPGADRIWWRGSVSGPASIDADWVRVRAE